MRLLKELEAKVFGTFTWQNRAALAWLAGTLGVSLGAVAHFPKIFLWVCVAGATLMSAGMAAVTLRTGRYYRYFANWNWIEGLLATTGCSLLIGSCIGMFVASLSQ